MVNTFIFLSPSGYTSFYEYCLAMMKLLDYPQRLGKQRPEALQILHSVIGWTRLAKDVGVPQQTSSVKETLKFLLQKFNELPYTYMFDFDGVQSIQCPKDKVLTHEETLQGCWIFKSGFANHSAVRMWLQYPDALKVYFNASVDAFVSFGGENNMRKYENIPASYEIPTWITSRRFLGTMQIALLKKKPEYYLPLFAQIHGVPLQQPLSLELAQDFSKFLAARFDLYESMPNEIHRVLDWTTLDKRGLVIKEYFWPVN